VAARRTPACQRHDRYVAYLAFLEDLGVSHAHTPYWLQQRVVDGRRIHFAGLDTAFLATADNMKGRLVLGLAQVNAMLTGARDADLVVALAHHPRDWLTDWDHDAVDPPLHARVDLLLRGHLHRARPSMITTPHHQLIEVPAGSLYAGSQWANSFQLIELDLPGNQARVHVRVWRPDADAWVPDLTGFPPDGVARFPLKQGSGTGGGSGGGPGGSSGGTQFHGGVQQVVQIQGGTGHTIHIGGPTQE